MAQVSVTVNGRSYRVACESGEEAQVRDFAAYLQNKVESLGGAVAQATEAQILLIAGLLTAEDLWQRVNMMDEIQQETERLKTEIARLHGELATRAATLEGRAAQGLERAAARIESVLPRLELR